MLKIMKQDLLQKIKNLPSPVIGVDEAGRGCLAGPVYAGAVILNNENTSYQDSKSLTPLARKILALEIYEQHQAGIGWASPQEIGQINILQASLLAMKRAVLKLNISKGALLIDGIYKIPGMDSFLQVPIVKGDALVSSISAASIIAKHFRDGEMSRQAKKYPHYGFEKHKGYPTAEHKKAIRQKGVCPIHRKNFSGVKEFMDQGSTAPCPL